MRLRALVVASMVVALVALGARAGASAATAAEEGGAHASAGVDWSGALHWRLIGPFRGGRVLAVTGVPGEPHHFYFGAVGGGVWETTNAGRTWQPIFDGQPVASIGAIAVAPSRPRTLYVGTGEADMRSDITQGAGVFRSDDGGHSWRFVGLGDSQQIGRILVDPHDPELVFVAALGHPYAANPERGVFRSRDGGAHWEKVLGPNDDTGAIDLAFEPGNPRVVYATLWQTRRPPWNVYPPSNGPGSGLWKSTDGGDHWSELTRNGLPAHLGRIGIAVAPTAPQRVYALVDAEADGGLYRSDDAGAHFTQQSTDRRIWQRGWYFGGVTVEPKDASTVWVCNTTLLRSGDGGKTFAPVEGDPTGDDFHQLWIDPEQPERRVLGVDQGTIVSLDGGRSWSSWHNQPTAQIYRVSTDDRLPYWIYGAQQDSGAVGLPSRTIGGDGITMEQFREVTAGGESGMIAPDPAEPEIVYGGDVEKLDLRTEQTRAVPPFVAYPDEHYRHTWTLPLVFAHESAPGKRPSLYFANQFLFRTDDGGEHWARISPDLTREDPGTPATLDPATAADNLKLGPRRGVIYAIAPSRTAEHQLWVGTDDGKIWRTRDDGAHWSDVTPAALTAWSKVGTLEASPFDGESAYAAVDRHRLDDFRPYVYRTRDGGASWQLAVSGIPDGVFVNAVRADPVRRGLLYAGTERGVYVSFDDGERWQSLQLDLPVTSVRDVEVHGADLVIATHGRGFWVLDDVTPLRTLDTVAASAASALLPPAAAVRLRTAAFTGTPLPKDEPTASNPPAGAMIDYLLRARSSSPVMLEIFDAEGALVRSYSSADTVRPYDPQKAGEAPQWFTAPPVLATTAGLHRFVWPLRYARGSSGDAAHDDGPWAPPGRYRVVLTAAGERHEQPLEVRPDPRLALPPSAYAEQLALARRVDALMLPLDGAADEAAAAIDSLDDRIAKAPASLAPALRAAREHVADLAGVALVANPANRWSFPPRRKDSIRFVDEALGTVYQAIESADAAPSPDAQSGLAQLEPQARAVLAAWKSLRAGELAQLDARLKKAGLPAISFTE